MAILNGKYKVKNSKNSYDIIHLETSASQVKFTDGSNFQEKLDSGVLTGPKGPKGDKGDKGDDGLTTSVTVDGVKYSHLNGNINLPNYPTLSSIGASPSNHNHDGRYLTQHQSLDNYYKKAETYTKAEVDTKVAGLVDSAPETLDTLNELSKALGNDPNFATTVSTQIGKKANKENAEFTGTTFSFARSGSVGTNSIAMGVDSEATGINSVGIGCNAKAKGDYSTALGYSAMATGQESFACGNGNTSSGKMSVTLGKGNTASNEYSVALGCWTSNNGIASLTQGNGASITQGWGALSSGILTTAKGMGQHVIGVNNIVDPTNVTKYTDKPTYLMIAGNGDINGNKSNAYTLDWDGNGWYQGNVSVDGTPSDDKHLVTKKFVNDNYTTKENPIPISTDGTVPKEKPLIYIDTTEDLDFEFLVDELNNLKQNKNPQTPMVFFESDEILALENKEQLANATFEARINSKVLTGYATLKIQGSSSSVMPKKNYTVKFFKDKEMTEKYKMNVGWGSNNKFCFKANYIDSSHTRNLSGARIARDMVAERPDSEFKRNLMKAPNFGHVDGFPIKVYINGEFHGIYTWNMPKDEDMLGMDKDNPNHISLCADKNGGGQTEPTTCQFRVEWDYTGKLGNSAGSAHWMWKVEAGPDSQETADKLNRVIRFVKDTDDTTFKKDFDKYLDLYSLIDYYCFSHLCCHIDGLGKNILFTTYDGLQWGTVLYDMDTIYGGWVSTSSVDFWRPYDCACPQDYCEPKSLLWERLVKLYSKELKQRYFELRKGALSLGNIVTHVEEIYERVTDRMIEDEWAKWSKIPVKEENTMSRFRTYMSKRAVFSDNYFNNL